jgi:hypothetical protein
VPLLVKCGLTNETGEHRYNFHLLRHAAASLFITYLRWPPKRIQDGHGPRIRQDHVRSMATCLKASRPTVRT